MKYYISDKNIINWEQVTKIDIDGKITEYKIFCNKYSNLKDLRKCGLMTTEKK